MSIAQYKVIVLGKISDQKLINVHSGEWSLNVIAPSNSMQRQYIAIKTIYYSTFFGYKSFTF